MKLCEKCQLNLIEDDADFCVLCAGESLQKRVQTTNFNDFELTVVRGKIPTRLKEIKANAGDRGILVYDQSRTLIGLVWRHGEVGSPSDGRAEICFYDDYDDPYGKWHRMSINEQPLMYDRLNEILDFDGQLTYYAAIKKRR